MIRRGCLLFIPAMLIVFPANSQTTNSRQDNIRICTQFGGSDAGAKIAACIADLPSTGGIADARGFDGTQTVTRNLFAGITKPVTVLLCASSLHVTVTQTMAATNNQRIIGCSSAGAVGVYGIQTTFVWDGPNGGTVILLDRVRDSVFENFAIIPGTGSIGIGIRIDHVSPPSGGTLSTHNRFRQITIGPATTGVQIGNNSTQNNAEHEFEDVYIEGPGTYGYFLNDAQSKFTRVMHGSIGFCTYGVYMNAGSFSALNVNMTHNGTDFHVENTVDVINIIGTQSEVAGRFFDMPNNTGAGLAVNLIGNRASPNIGVNTDTYYIRYRASGVLTMIGNDFNDGVFSGPGSMYPATLNLGTFHRGGSTVISRGNKWWRDDIWKVGVLSEADISSEGDVGIDSMGNQTKIQTIRGTQNGALTLAKGANNDITLAPNISGFYRISGPTGAFSISGFTRGQSGYSIRVFNTTAQQMTIKNLTGSAAANQIQTLTGTDVVLRAGTSVAEFLYDAQLQKWLLVSSN